MLGIRETTWISKPWSRVFISICSIHEDREKFLLKISYTVNSLDVGLDAKILSTWAQVWYHKPEILQTRLKVWKRCSAPSLCPATSWTQDPCVQRPQLFLLPHCNPPREAPTLPWLRKVSWEPFLNLYPLKYCLNALVSIFAAWVSPTPIPLYSGKSWESFSWSFLATLQDSFAVHLQG